MKIQNNTIIFKSMDEFYFKEESGKKPGTVRFFHDLSEIKDMIDFHAGFDEGELKFIEIHNKKSPNLSFKREIKDISQLPDMWAWIISWVHKQEHRDLGTDARTSQH